MSTKSQVKSQNSTSEGQVLRRIELSLYSQQSKPENLKLFKKCKVMFLIDLPSASTFSSNLETICKGSFISKKRRLQVMGQVIPNQKAGEGETDGIIGFEIDPDNESSPNQQLSTQSSASSVHSGKQEDSHKSPVFGFDPLETFKEGFLFKYCDQTTSNTKSMTQIERFTPVVLSEKTQDKDDSNQKDAYLFESPIATLIEHKDLTRSDSTDVVKIHVPHGLFQLYRNFVNWQFQTKESTEFWFPKDDTRMICLKADKEFPKTLLLLVIKKGQEEQIYRYVSEALVGIEQINEKAEFKIDFKEFVESLNVLLVFDENANTKKEITLTEESIKQMLKGFEERMVKKWCSKDDLKELKDDVKQDIKELKDDVKQDVKELKDDLAVIKQILESIKPAEAQK